MTEVDIVAGLAAALTLEHLGWAFAGAFLGTLVGVLPGLGPVATIALLLPTTFFLPPTGSLIMLAGIYYGAQYGSSTTAILLNVPGEASGAVTAVSGHKMAREGRAVEALAVATLASAVAGVLSALVLALATPALARASLAIGPADVAAMMVLAGALAVVLSAAPLARGFAMLGLGGMLGLIGTAGPDGLPRFTFGMRALFDGIGFVPLVVGLFGMSEALALAARGTNGGAVARIGRWWPGAAAIRGWLAPALRGSLVGAAIGLVPGATTLVSSFAAWSLEKRVSRGAPEGRRDIAGVAAPEAANNASAQTGFVALFGLGIPSNAVTAVLVGAMMIHGLPPGPALMSREPTLFWTFVGSMLIANLMLVVLNLPLVGLWARLVTVPPLWLVPGIVLVSGVGVLASGGLAFDVVLLALFGGLGYALRRTGFPLLPLLVGFVLAPIFEDHLRRAIAHARGDLATLASEPLASGLLAAAALATTYALWRRGQR
ncbi:tripartite tricarboxylate transporter permease [Salinarimonas sp. NSM]|uniref:tripartite tricarboxylate transporter permease n=1 Tax=Salinarimonas sp. NSM TaxID=3458003 RepID=UPI0040355246